MLNKYGYYPHDPHYLTKDYMPTLVKFTIAEEITNNFNNYFINSFVKCHFGTVKIIWLGSPEMLLSCAANIGKFASACFSADLELDVSV